MLFNEIEVFNRIGTAAKSGFQAVEIQWPYAFEPPSLAAAADAAGVQFVLINVPAGDLGSGGRGLAGVPGLERDFHTAVQQGLVYAREMHCPRVNVIAGRINVGDERERHLATYIDNVRHAAELFGSEGVNVCIEAINDKDMQGSLMSTQQTAVEVLAAVDHPNVTLQFDSYHVAMMEEDPTARFVELVDNIGHIQFADAPGRHQPGQGEIDFAAFFTAVERSSYQGWCGAEYRPTATTADSLGWFRDL